MEESNLMNELSKERKSIKTDSYILLFLMVINQRR